MNISQIKTDIKSALDTLIGKDISDNLYRKLCVRRYLKAGIIFIHIPRAAGTSVSKVVLGKRAGHFTASEVANELGMTRYQSLFSFSICRHPLDRLVSSYHYAKQGGSKDGGITKNESYESPDFETFESFVTQWLIHQDMSSIDYIFRPQYNFVYDQNGEQLVNHIGQLEKIKETEKILSTQLNRTISFSKFNSSQRSIDYRSYYNPKILSIVTDLYRRDFEYLGYKPEA